MPLTDRQWQAVLMLDGQTLVTPGGGAAGPGRPFIVSRRSAAIINVQPAASLHMRQIRRRDFDRALALGVSVDDLRPGLLQKLMQTGSYVVAILRELHRRGEL